MNTAEQTDVAPSIAIIGAGFAGLCMAIRLKEAGIHSFTILEKSSSVGGTWRDNTYPGAACDVQSHLYSFSFEPKHDWSRKFGLQPEIRAYMEQCAEKYGLKPHIRFNTEVVSTAFDKTSGQWEIKTRTGDTLRANILVTGTGQLNRPAYPRLPGLDQFAGKTFHSARWDHNYALKGKRVAVIGTGASAIQFVPQIAPKVAKLDLYQRSPPWVIPKPDRAFTALEQWLFQSFGWWDRLYRALIYWTIECRAFGFTNFLGLRHAMKFYELLARWNIRRAIKDKTLRRKLIPDYPIGCKRILIANDWYPALDRDNVEVIDTGIERVEKDAIVGKDGARRPADAIIFGTGFQTTDFLAPIQITGLDGLDLNQAWLEGAEAYKGISVAGFPNLFMTYGPNTNLAHNSIIFMLESQVRYILQCVRLLLDPGLHYMDVRADRQALYNQGMQHRLKDSVWTTCTNWYRTASGKITNNWLGFTVEYRLMTSKLDLMDYELIPAPGHAG